MNEREQLELFGSAELLDLLALVAQQTGCMSPEIVVLNLQHRPGAGVSGLYEVRHADGVLHLGATAEDVGEPAGTMRLSSPAGQVTVWRHPADPRIPGLALVFDPPTVERLWGEGRRLTDLQTLTYRPLRRAVLRAAFEAGEGRTTQVFLKALRSDAELLHTKHRLLLEAGVPAPEPVRKPVEQVLATRQVSGRPLAKSLMHERELALAPDRVVALLDALPETLMEVAARPAWSDRLDRYAHAASTALPDQHERIMTLVGRISDVIATARRGPRRPSHGDLYEANVFIEDGQISGLLDVDSAGPGYLVDDLACFVAHLAVLPGLDRRYVHVPAALERYREHFADALDDRGADPAGLFARSAAVTLTLVAGARTPDGDGWRAQALDRLRTAEGLLDP